MGWRGSCANHLSLQGLELEGEPTNNRNELLTTLAPVMQGLEGCGCGGPAQVEWASEGVEVRPPETLKEEKPMWRRSNPEREEAGVASR